MAKIYKSVEELIGRTPMVELSNLEDKLNLNVTLMAKVEALNPGGSAKDRVAKRMVEDAEKLGADAIVNIRYASSAIMQGAAEVIAYGTAVKFK